MLKELPEPAFQRTGMHSERGQTTVLDWLRIYAVHAEKHTQQIRDARAAFKQAKAAEAKIEALDSCIRPDCRFARGRRLRRGR